MSEDKRPIITLITDWKSEDYYVGAIKGKILSECPNANIVDVNHQINSYSISTAAFVLKNSYSHFPKGSIHIISVSCEASKKKAYTTIEYDGHFFVSVDNGIFALMLDDEEADNIVEIRHDGNAGSFAELTVLASAATKLANNESISSLGTKKDEVFRVTPLKPVIGKYSITGHVIYIDSFGNLIINITKDLFDEMRDNREFVIYAHSRSNRITKINNSYNESSNGELLAIFNSSNNLEIAIRNGEASQLLNLHVEVDISIVFEDKKEIVKGTLF